MRAAGRPSFAMFGATMARELERVGPRAFDDPRPIVDAATILVGTTSPAAAALTQAPSARGDAHDASTNVAANPR
jgi:hypothetical protein